MVVSYPMEFYKFVRDSGLSSASQMIDSWSGELVKGVNPAKDEIIIPLHNIVNSINLFVQLACIIFLCNKIQTNKAVSIFYEALVDEFLDLSVRLQLSTFDTVALMKILAIANYFPEIYLPLSFILDTVHIWDVSKKLLCSKNRVSDVGAPTNVGNVP
ncbi:hypothetical protein B9Z55_017262 [Caenorhabditis nigoni]|uniref:Uncharacterized protein n=1 Tax=Caenorhabditis nigoni TaxID=1611254 RepID=A0A2G5T8B5_9PELO|nr:hypothetical protein B9Z55_017262 [Caenorhabditis nigoni]